MAELVGVRTIGRCLRRGRIGGAAAVAISVLLTLCACATPPTSGGPSQARMTPTGAPSATRAALIPSFPSGTTTCGEYLISATTTAGTQPLLSCAGLTLARPPHVVVQVGDRIFISGLSGRTFVTASPAGTLEGGGALLTAKRTGTATITVHNWFCAAVDGTQPASCPLAQVIVQ